MFAVTFIISPARSSYSQTDLQLIRQPNTFHITWVRTNNKMHNGSLATASRLNALYSAVHISWPRG